MKNQTQLPIYNLKGAVLVSDAEKSLIIRDRFADFGISCSVWREPEKLLKDSVANPLDIVIAEDAPMSMSCTKFLSELLKISWTTSTILVCDEDENIVHERTEGLGILGYLRSLDDVTGLDALIKRFLEIHTENQP